MNRSEAIGRFQLSPEMPILTVVGGSQGSEAINRVVSASVGYLSGTLDIQVIWQTGPSHYDALRPIESECKNVRLFPFLERIGPAYSAADLVVSRAGALTLAEIAQCGKPSLLIPFPGASADHQTKNAALLEDAGAAAVIAESHLSEEQFVAEVETLVKNPQELSEMGKAAKSLSTTHADEKIVDEILELVEP